MTEKNRLLIIAALNLFIRNYVVNPTLDNNGVPVGGSIGFLKSFQKLTRRTRPHEIIVAWDGIGGSQRKKSQNKDYKAKLWTHKEHLKFLKAMSLYGKDFSKIASFGYNGSYPGANVYESTGTIEESLEPGQSGLIHAELNMIAKFQEADPENYIVILTLSPCKDCTKILCTAGFKHVYWIEEYREREHLDIFDKCEVTYGLISDLQSDYHPKII